MKKLSLFKKMFAFAFTAAVLFTVSVRDVHYLLTQHVVLDDNCENHLHQDDGHAHCSICKFDISFFSNDIQTPQFNHTTYLVRISPAAYTSVIRSADVSPSYLRGPPVTA